MDDCWKTRNTLLNNAWDHADDAWHEFIAFYRPFILYLLQRIQIPSNDMDDVSQDVLLTLWRKLELYAKDKGKFKSWLSRIVRNTAYNYLTRCKRVDALREAV